jgi:hypothetical protein
LAQEEVALEELTVDADGMSELRKDRSRYRLAMDIADRFRGTQLIVPKVRMPASGPAACHFVVQQRAQVHTFVNLASV